MRLKNWLLNKKSSPHSLPTPVQACRGQFILNLFSILPTLPIEKAFRSGMAAAERSCTLWFSSGGGVDP